MKNNYNVTINEIRNEEGKGVVVHQNINLREQNMKEGKFNGNIFVYGEAGSGRGIFTKTILEKIPTENVTIIEMNYEFKGFLSNEQSYTSLYEIRHDTYDKRTEALIDSINKREFTKDTILVIADLNDYEITQELYEKLSILQNSLASVILTTNDLLSEENDNSIRTYKLLNNSSYKFFMSAFGEYLPHIENMLNLNDNQKYFLSKRERGSYIGQLGFNCIQGVIYADNYFTDLYDNSDNVIENLIKLVDISKLTKDKTLMYDVYDSIFGEGYFLNSEIMWKIAIYNLLTDIYIEFINKSIIVETYSQYLLRRLSEIDTDKNTSATVSNIVAIVKGMPIRKLNKYFYFSIEEDITFNINFKDL